MAPSTAPACGLGTATVPAASASPVTGHRRTDGRQGELLGSTQRAGWSHHVATLHQTQNHMAGATCWQVPGPWCPWVGVGFRGTWPSGWTEFPRTSRLAACLGALSVQGPQGLYKPLHKFTLSREQRAAVGGAPASCTLEPLLGGGARISRNLGSSTWESSVLVLFCFLFVLRILTELLWDVVWDAAEL